MGRLNRRRLPLRRFGRPSPPAAPSSPETPAEGARNGDSTEFAIVSVPSEASASRPRPPQTSAPELPSIQPYEDPDTEPVAPSRLVFSCPCGAKLVAIAATYDKHSRCSICQTVLLLNLVYDPEHRSHEIVPFRVGPDSAI